MMKIKDIVNELDPKFVNSQVNKSEWKQLGQGLTATVWQQITDPDTVVKLVGAGTDHLLPGEKAATLAFVEFCLDHGNKSKHFPKIYEINTDDPEVVQIRLERLNPLGAGLRGRLEYMASELKYGGKAPHSLIHLEDTLDGYGGAIRANNTAADLIEATKMLIDNASIYGHKFWVENMMVDLHGYNWMIRPNGTIVAVDPWYGHKIRTLIRSPQ